MQNELPSNITLLGRKFKEFGHRGKIMKKDVCTCFLKSLKKRNTIKSQIEEEVPDNVTPYGEIERIPMTPMRKKVYRAACIVESYLTANFYTQLRCRCNAER